RQPSAELWRMVAAEWQVLDCPYFAAYAQWRQAEELFGSRARAQATRALAAALRTAKRLGCIPLEKSLRTLARHAGVPPDELEESRPGSTVPAPRRPSSDRLQLPLTPREWDVLGM